MEILTAVCAFPIGYIRDGIFCHFVASMISGLVTTAASMPVDIAKTRWVSIIQCTSKHRMDQNISSHIACK